MEIQLRGCFLLVTILIGSTSSTDSCLYVESDDKERISGSFATSVDNLITEVLSDTSFTLVDFLGALRDCLVLLGLSDNCNKLWDKPMLRLERLTDDACLVGIMCSVGVRGNMKCVLELTLRDCLENNYFKIYDIFYLLRAAEK